MKNHHPAVDSKLWLNGVKVPWIKPNEASKTEKCLSQPFVHWHPGNSLQSFIKIIVLEPVGHFSFLSLLMRASASTPLTGVFKATVLSAALYVWTGWLTSYPTSATPETSRLGRGSVVCPVCSGDTYRVSGSRLSIQGLALLPLSYTKDEKRTNTHTITNKNTTKICFTNTHLTETSTSNQR